MKKPRYRGFFMQGAFCDECCRADALGWALYIATRRTMIDDEDDSDTEPEYSEAFAAMILAEDAKGNGAIIAAEDLLAELDRMIARAQGKLH